MNQKITKIYEEMYRILLDEFHDYKKAWDCLVEFLVISNYPKFLFMVKHKFEWLFQNAKLAGKLKRIYNIKLLKSDKHDYLGDLLVKYGNKLEISYDINSIIPPDEIVEKIIKKNIKETKKAINILDLGTSTGRFILKLSEIAPNCVIFGIDKNIRLLRIAFANCTIHNIHSYLLCADYLIHNYDYSTARGRNNWQHANKWYPHWHKLELKQHQHK